jgi:monothiol glutaredoxin
MNRPILDEAHIYPAIRSKIAEHQSPIIAEVQAAIEAHPIVVIGMAQNPYPKKARRALDAKGVAYHYLEYGSYLRDWRRRTALKMWTGWPTMPLIFVKGVLIGGADDLERLLATGELDQMLSGSAERR